MFTTPLLGSGNSAATPHEGWVRESLICRLWQPWAQRSRDSKLVCREWHDLFCKQYERRIVVVEGRGILERAFGNTAGDICETRQTDTGEEELSLGLGLLSTLLLQMSEHVRRSWVHLTRSVQVLLKDWRRTGADWPALNFSFVPRAEKYSTWAPETWSFWPSPCSR